MAKWIEFASIRRTAPLLAVLAHYRIRELLGSGKDHLRGRCPLYGGEGRDIFHADTAEQVFHCFSCAAGGSVLDLVAALEHCSLRQAAERVRSATGISFAGSGSAASLPRYEGD